MSGETGARISKEHRGRNEGAEIRVHLILNEVLAKNLLFTLYNVGPDMINSCAQNKTT